MTSCQRLHFLHIIPGFWPKLITRTLREQQLDTDHKTSHSYLRFWKQKPRKSQPQTQNSIKMCQLCYINDLAKRDRWPKPLEHHKADIEFLVTSAHSEYEKYKAKPSASSNDIQPGPPEALLNVLRILADLLDQIDSDRQTWWSSPEKRHMRQQLEEDGNQQKLSALHKINNDVNERIEGMNARLGQFVKWSLNLKGGVWELQHGCKVDAGSSK